jgi:hypothetical protein
MKKTTGLFSVLALGLLTGLAHAAPTSELTLEGATINPGPCADASTSGGVHEEGADYQAHCEGTGLGPLIEGGQRFLHHLVFATAPDPGGVKDRSEIVVARERPFRKYHYLGFRLMIPRDAPVTDGYFYLSQLWQCHDRPPFAGLKLNRGSAYSWNFMVRNDEQLDGGTAVATGTFTPGVWHAFVIRINVNPGAAGSIKIWVDDGPPVTWSGDFGYDSICTSSSFNAKLGIYKAAEDSFFEVRADDIRFGDTFEDVKPW